MKILVATFRGDAAKDQKAEVEMLYDSSTHELIVRDFRSNITQISRFSLQQILTKLIQHNIRF